MLRKKYVKPRMGSASARGPYTCPTAIAIASAIPGTMESKNSSAVTASPLAAPLPSLHKKLGIASRKVCRFIRPSPPWKSAARNASPGG